MPLSDRDYIRGSHPPTCSCTECTRRRLEGFSRQGRIEKPKKRRSIWEPHLPVSKKEEPKRMRPAYTKAKPSRFLNNLVKLTLNLAILLGLYLLGKYFYQLFITHSVEALKGSITLIIGLAIWITIIKVSKSKKYRWKKPSFKLTTFLTIVVLAILTFAGVQPFSTYKDSLVTNWKTRAEQATFPEAPQPTPNEPTPINPPEAPTILAFEIFTDKPTGFSTEYPRGWAIRIIPMDNGEIRVSFTGRISETNEAVCSLLVGYDSTFTDSYGLWKSLVNLAGDTLIDKKDPSIIGGIRGYELTQVISGETSRIFTSDWKSGNLLAIRSYPTNELSLEEIEKLNSYLDHLIASASIITKPTTIPPTSKEEDELKQELEQQELVSVENFATLFNGYRQSYGLSILTFTDDLNKRASLRLSELKLDYSHNSLGNYNLHLAENLMWISFGGLTNYDAFNSWRDSPGHRQNMLDPRYKYTGYAIGGDYAVQLFSSYPTIDGEPQLPPGWYWPD